MALTPKQQRFVEEYLIDLNATQAAIRAGYSERTAKQQGQRLLTNVDVQQAVQAGRHQQQVQSGIDAARVLSEFAAVALSDVGDVLDFTGTDPKLRPVNEIPEQARRAIASVKVKRYMEGSGEWAKEVEIMEFRFWPKLDALKELAARVEPPKPDKPLQVDITSKGEPIGRDSITAADLAAAAALVGMAGLRVPPDGGSQPVDAAHAPPSTTAVPAAH